MGPYSLTIGDALDRLEVLGGKIGMNTREQAYALLAGLDEVYRGMQEIENEQSRKVAEAQFGGIVARLEREAGLMLRDLGGRAALAEARAKANPPEEHSWWYLDEHISTSRKKAARRALIVGGIILAALVVLGAAYQIFLAPDPAVVARYGFQQSAQDMLMRSDYTAALEEADQGLAAAPRDPTLLTLKGVAQELLGQADQAQASYQAAMQQYEKPEDFYVVRGQAYVMASQLDKALADAQEAIRLNPNIPEAYLLSGQAHEILQMPREALADYDKAYQAAEATGQVELSAMARMRTAMLMQAIGNMAQPGQPPATETP